MDSKIPELPPDQAEVVRWLRTPAGEGWSQSRIGFCGRIHHHARARESGVFADIFPMPSGPAARLDYRGLR